LADGTRVVVIPLFWASQGYWYLDVQVFNTPAREGVMGPILAADWLPRAPDGSSFGLNLSRCLTGMCCSTTSLRMHGA